jgi:heptosyltransferase III
LRQLRAERYDLALDPIPESTGGRVALTLCRARYRVGFLTGSQWAPLTHAVATPDTDMHQALLPVFLFSQLVGEPDELRGLQLTLCLRPEEIESGRAAVAQAVEPFARRQLSSGCPASRTFGFFAHATGLKVIDRSWWVAFWEAFLELEPEAIPVEFLPPQTDAPGDSRFPSLQFSSLRALTGAIAATRMFISADTGPMHLASSTAVPTVALFRATDPVLYGPLKPVDLAINIAESTPSQVALRCRRVWRECEGGARSPSDSGSPAAADAHRQLAETGS